MTTRKRAEWAAFWRGLGAKLAHMLRHDPVASRGGDDQRDDELGLVERDAQLAALAEAAGATRGSLVKRTQLEGYWSAGQVSQLTEAKLRATCDQLAHLPLSLLGIFRDAFGVDGSALWTHWSSEPIAAASLGQVYAVTWKPEHAPLGQVECVVKVQYPGVAASLAEDVRNPRVLATLVGPGLSGVAPEALTALGEALVGETDYRQELSAMTRLRDAWVHDPVLRFPVPIPAYSNGSVLTMSRCEGARLLDVSANAAQRSVMAAALYRYYWLGPAAHGVGNADPNPGNVLVQVGETVTVAALDFGNVVALTPTQQAQDRELLHALMDHDGQRGAERLRTTLAATGLLARTDALALDAHRDWERVLREPFASPQFHWNRAYAHRFWAATRAALACSTLALSAEWLMLWRMRIGAAATLAELDARFSPAQEVTRLLGPAHRALR